MTEHTDPTITETKTKTVPTKEELHAACEILATGLACGWTPHPIRLSVLAVLLIVLDVVLAVAFAVVVGGMVSAVVSVLFTQVAVLTALLSDRVR